MGILTELFLTFLKIGAFTFGGGYAMIALIEEACVTKKKWITHDEMMDVTVIAESTPGPIAINCATFVGYKRAGIKGALVATFGVVLPSFLIILGISFFLEQFMEIQWVAKAFAGIRIGVGIVILNAGINMIRKMKKDPLSIGILICAGAMMGIGAFGGWGVSSITLMILAGAVSLTVFGIRRARGGVKR